MIDLGTLGGHRSSALDINDRGDIAGSCEAASHRMRACLWQMGERHPES